MTAPRLPLCLTLTALAAMPLVGSAATIDQIGVFPNWPTSWTPIPGLNDPVDGGLAAKVDFVGDATDPGGYFANEGGYLFFRMRVNEGTVIGTYPSATRTFQDSLMVLIDVVGATINTGTGLLTPTETDENQRKPDYGFAWDARLNPVGHGLEMQRGSGTFIYQGNWNTASMEDLDNSAGSKLVNDINGVGGARSGDGYVRTIDGQATTNFGSTSYIDYAVSWSYLQSYTGLLPSQTWNITFASIFEDNDHSDFKYDIAAGATANTPVTSSEFGWTPFPPAAVPAPASLPLIGLGLLAMGWARRRNT
ncbi:MAG TPA: PEP-CTERM sorting domain-containing protein [Lamprocystis sp. (in: g-proteobacteria)]|nr:PEP-CTERM sorting domain-containing protein [Lamprocystis sp. (in: g-proteobacteria)]